MGTFSILIEIGSPDGARYEPVNALVDTGANYTVIPATLLRQLGVRAHRRVAFLMADGRQIRRDVGRAWIRIGGKSEITLVVFGDDDAGALLGDYALQGLLLAVDAGNERLIPALGLL